MLTQLVAAFIAAAAAAGPHREPQHSPGQPWRQQRLRIRTEVHTRQLRSSHPAVFELRAALNASKRSWSSADSGGWGCAVLHFVESLLLSVGTDVAVAVLTKCEGQSVTQWVGSCSNAALSVGSVGSELVTGSDGGSGSVVGVCVSGFVCGVTHEHKCGSSVPTAFTG